MATARTRRWAERIARHSARTSPLLVLLIGLALTGLSTSGVRWGLARRDAARLEAQVATLADRIGDRLAAYIDTLVLTKAYFAVTPESAPAAFRAFFGEMHLLERHPGIQGVGLAPRVPPAERAAHEAQVRAAGTPHYRIWPDGDGGDAFPIAMLEPPDWRNERALGFDMYGEPNRRAAMQRARDSGEPAATVRLTLVQETLVEPQPGFLVYVPVYAAGEPHGTVEERRAALRAFVYAPFRARDLLATLAQDEAEAFDLLAHRVYDGDSTSPEALLGGRWATDEELAGRPILRREIRFAGTTWTLIAAPRPGTGDPNGRTLPAITALFGALGSLLLFAIVSGVRRRADIERRLRDEEASGRAFIETILRTTPAFVVVLDPRGHIVFFNRFAEELTGWRAGEVLGSNWFGHFLESSEREQTEGVFEALARSPAEGSEHENIVLTRDGRRRLIAWQNAAVRGPDGSLRYVIAAGVDVTERRREEAERAQLLERSQRDVESLRIERDLREKFVATLSHDMRNPLGAARMNAQFLSRRLPPEDVRLATRVVSNIDRANQMIEDLLDANRIRAGQQLPLRISYFDLAGLVRDAIEDLAIVFGSRVVVRAPESLEGHWSTDAVRRIVENLVANAVKYGAGDRPVTVTVTESGEHATIAVHNEGPAIPPEILQTLFEPFYRAPAADRSDRRGWGLGLTLVRGLAQALGGDVRVTSTAEEGTTFAVDLPRDARPFRS